MYVGASATQSRGVTEPLVFILLKRLFQLGSSDMAFIPDREKVKTFHFFKKKKKKPKPMIRIKLFVHR